MTSVPSSAPALSAGVTLALLETPPAVASGTARAKGTAAAPTDVVIEAAAKAGASTSSSKTSKASKTTTTAKKKKSTSTTKSGYASSASLPKDLTFLRDPKLSVEEKLMRFLAYMNAKSEAEITKKLEEMGGGAAAKSGATSSGGGTGGTKAKTKGFWGTALDVAKTGIPALGLTFQALKNPTTKAMLKQLGGPVLAAAAAAIGFPQAAPVLAKLGPQIVDYAAAGLQAVEKAAAAEQQGTSSASGSGSTGGASGAGTGKSEQLQLLELNRLVEKQKEMFQLTSNMLKAWHDTRSHIIGNLR
jgi:hypothetical protein